VTRNAHSPAELLLDVIAARILCSGAAVPQYDLEHPPASAADLRAFIADGPGVIVAALHAAGALPPASPVPGQLAGLCTRVGIPGHGITAPPATDLPEPWHSMLTRPRRLPQAAPAPGIAAATIAELPELDGARITILGLHHATIVGLHNSATQTIVHILVSGVTPEDDWTYGRVIRPLPTLWVRDSSGRWHATRTNGTGPTGTSSEVIMWLEIAPPLDSGTAWIDVVATGRSAEARVRLPICWKLNPQQRPLGPGGIDRLTWVQLPGALATLDALSSTAGPCRISWLTSPPSCRKTAQRSRRTRRSSGAIRC